MFSSPRTNRSKVSFESPAPTSSTSGFFARLRSRARRAASSSSFQPSSWSATWLGRGGSAGSSRLGTQLSASSRVIVETCGFGAAACPPSAASSLMSSKAALLSAPSISSVLCEIFLSTRRMGVSTRKMPPSRLLGSQLRSMARKDSGLPSSARMSRASCHSASASDSSVMSIVEFLGIVEK